MQAGAAARSPDVMVIDPASPELTQQGIPVALDVQASFGKSVALSGLGLDGKLAGKLHVAQAPGRETLATGTLNVSGSYQRRSEERRVGKECFSNGRSRWSPYN